MNATIQNLHKRQQKVLKIRNDIKWSYDKSEPIPDPKLGRLDKLLDKIGRVLKTEYNKLYTR